MANNRKWSGDLNQAAWRPEDILVFLSQDELRSGNQPPKSRNHAYALTCNDLHQAKATPFFLIRGSLVAVSNPGLREKRIELEIAAAKARLRRTSVTTAAAVTTAVSPLVLHLLDGGEDETKVDPKSKDYHGKNNAGSGKQ